MPDADDYSAFQRNVADAMDDARALIAAVAAEFTAHFGRRRPARSSSPAIPRRGAALVAVGTIGDTAQELLEDDDDLLVVRVHAYRPFPAAELAAALARLRTSPWSTAPRPSARSARSAATSSRSSSAREGRGEHRLRARRRRGDAATLRCALEQTRDGARGGPGPVYVPEGGVMAAWLDEIVAEEQLLLPGHSACAGCGPAINIRHVLGGLAAAKPESKIVLVIPASCWTIIAGVFPVNAFGVAVHLTPFASAAVEASAIKAALRLRGHGDTTVVVWGGDGSTSDIGFSGVSAAAERNEDIVYVLNDNEAYMNTGVQKSGATPEGAWTTTTPAGAPRVGREEGDRAGSWPRTGSRTSRRSRSARCRCCATSGRRSRGRPSSRASASCTSSAPARPAGATRRPVDRARAARGRVAVLPALRVRPRRVADHVPAEAPGAGRRVPRDAGPLRPPRRRREIETIQAHVDERWNLLAG